MKVNKFCYVVVKLNYYYNKSIVKAQNPKGVGDFLLVQLKLFLGVKKEHA